MAFVENENVDIKNGITVEIGSAVNEDAESLLVYGQSVSEDHEFQAMYPDEFSITLEQEYKFIEENTSSENKLALVARVDGEVIAMINLHPISRLRKMAHVVSLGIGIKKDYRDSGLGQKLFSKALDWVKNSTDYEKIEFGVLSSNSRAIHLYKKFGCTEEACQKNVFKFGESDYRDNLIMSLFVKRD